MTRREETQRAAVDLNVHRGAEPAPAPCHTVSDLAAMQCLGLETAATMSTAWVDAMAEWNREVIAFMAQRIREEISTQTRALTCKDIGELQAIQAEFFQTAIEQYTRESGKLADLSRSLIPATLSSMKG